MIPSIIALIIILMLVIFIRGNNLTEPNISKEYSVLITDSFSEKDSEYMRPIFTLLFTHNGDQEEAVLCHVLDNNGELALEEAGEMMIMNIKSAFKNNAFVRTMVHNESLLTDGEKHVVEALNKEIDR
ncbi:hypothetical protein [Pelosinus sp. IPA-1]|uniref:hypothetical protein n=1 Tax=Pelosinus sp. IPA-1 TaxID=3029569 RepID=UPI0024362425|nr:hypothetical protein [Pelosinus sp. IPA-1]GMA99502.1 hypothetical protein PIPA1_23020 [Pelosinus sp. IPA-1]